MYISDSKLWKEGKEIGSRISFNCFGFWESLWGIIFCSSNYRVKKHKIIRGASFDIQMMKREEALPPSKIKHPLFPSSVSQIKSLVSFLGRNHCTISHDSKQVLFPTIDYVEFSVSLRTFESQSGPLIWDGGSISMSICKIL